MKNWRGSFAIPMTPYDDRNRIDEDVLRAEIDFCVECGVGGIVVPVMVSEFQALSEDERRLMIRVPVEASAGRVPVVANVAGINTAQAVGYACYAQQVGAQGVIAMPPYGLHPDFATTYAYYQAISEAVDLTIWIQNAGIVALSPDQVVRLCTEIKGVSWVKEEVAPEIRSISALMARNCPAVEGVMGGNAGRYLLTEYARGARGVVHACQFCDLVQRIWDFLDEGKDEEAGDLFEKVLPGLVIEGIMGMAFAKEIMVRRGVFKNHRMRMESQPLSQADMKEIDRVWKRILPYLIWKK